MTNPCERARAVWSGSSPRRTASTYPCHRPQDDLLRRDRHRRPALVVPLPVADDTGAMSNFRWQRLRGGILWAAQKRSRRRTEKWRRDLSVGLDARRFGGPERGSSFIRVTQLGA